jgi:N-acetylmuramoyl-L-alanine amidase
MAIKVYVDQGHNPRGFNTGAEGNGFYEQDITYRIGKILYDYLESDPNFTAKLSRPTEDTVLGTNNSTSLSERVRDANSWGADVLVSLHTNAAENPNATGSEGLIYNNSATVAKAIATDILYELNLVTGLRNRGIVERPGLYILRRSQMPAMIIELGFISNPYDAELLSESPYLFSTGIYRGILKYYGLL